MLDDYPHKRHTERGRKGKFSHCDIEPVLADILSGRGIEKMYSHQCEGIAKVRAGENLVVTAPTASGKSEIYIIPVVEAALKNECSLLIYPTKALSRDQLARFREFSLLGVRCEVYDGDTTQHAREKIRTDLPQIIITNIDMLHFMLQNERLFVPFWKKLRFVVIDELHSYSGVLGSHAGNILSRLKRIANHYASASASPEKPNDRHIQFICTSATIKNPAEFAETLCAAPFVVQTADEAPKPNFEHLLVNPEDVSYTTAALRIARELNKKTLIFGNSHGVVERLGAMAKEENYNLHVYRSGLDEDERKQIERDFKSGKYECLATTSALELGIDIGSVDAVILAGFPGTITRVRQRIGRAGRKGQLAHAVLICRENPLDQYYYENPEKYLRGTPESCFANPNNENIKKFHLLAKCRDMPLSTDDMDEQEKVLAKKLIEEEMISEWAAGGGFIPTKKALAELRKAGIRGAGDSIRILDSDTKRFIGERSEHMALGELFEGAIYMHGGDRFVSERLDLENHIAYVRRSFDNAPEMTLPIREKTAEEIECYGTRDCFGVPISWGEAHIIDSVVGYTKKDYFTDRVIDKHYFEEPLVREFDTQAVWLDYEFASDIENFAHGLHALEHVSISMIPAVSGADPGELGGISYPNGRMFIYDGVPDGNGVSKIVFERFEEVSRMALERLTKCKCEKGCPKCILDPMCGNQNRYLDKAAGKLIAERFVSNNGSK